MISDVLTPSYPIRLQKQVSGFNTPFLIRDASPIEPEENKTIKFPAMKANMNKKLNFKLIKILNLERQDHFIQLITNKNQEIQTVHNPTANYPQSPHLQNQAKLKGKLQYPNKGYNQPMTMILEAKQVNQSPYPICPQGVPKLESTPTLLTTSYPSRSREKGGSSLVTEDKSAKRSKVKYISAGSKKQEKGSNSKNHSEIVPDSETDQPEQLD
ncbi:MAG: hypothetical protein EZS28_012233 [Streblomastix strix]|uniref:Uncharacterized protein n=1 Tax=Streblomastix strix TaxID=222440 RepID=A0A5J4WBH0_9EUKA|nr:MAG: hypothetical protein EZS28_012233 [Streblomastix strix]